MKNYKIIHKMLSLLLFCTLILISINVGVVAGGVQDEIIAEIDDNIVQIRGTANGLQRTAIIMVVKTDKVQGITKDIINANDSSFVYANEVQLDNSGAFSDTFSIKDVPSVTLDKVSDMFTAILSYDGGLTPKAVYNFEYIYQSSIALASSNIKNASAPEIMEYLDKDGGTVAENHRRIFKQKGLLIDAYDSLRDKSTACVAVANLIGQLSSSVDFDDELKKIFNQVVALQSINQSQSENDVVIYGSFLNLVFAENSNYNYENTKSDSLRQAMAKKMLFAAKPYNFAEGSNYISYPLSQVSEQYYLAMLLFDINNAEFIGLWELINNNTAKLGLINNSSYSYYTNLNNSDKQKDICKKIVVIARNNPFYTKTAFLTAFEQAVRDYQSENTTVTGPSGNVSVIKSSGTKTVTPQPTIEPVPVVPIEKTEFIDIDTVPWAKECIEELAKLNIVSGDGNRFYPEDNVTREQFIKMLIGAFGLLDTNANCDFTDVNESDWFYSYIASAQKIGISDGYGDGTFGVGNKITREEMATLAYRTALKCSYNFHDSKDTDVFEDDSTISSYARDAVYKMKQDGVINGFDNNYFNPKETATRAQAAKVICTLIDGGTVE